MFRKMIKDLEFGKGVISAFFLTLTVAVYAMFTIGVWATLGAAVFTVICVCLCLGVSGMVRTLKNRLQNGMSNKEGETEVVHPKLRVIRGGKKVNEETEQQRRV